MNIDDTDISDSDLYQILSSSVWKYLGEREPSIPTDLSETELMLCVITHIKNIVIDNKDDDNTKQVNNLIKPFIYVLSDDELHFTQEYFWSDYARI